MTDDEIKAALEKLIGLDREALWTKGNALVEAIGLPRFLSFSRDNPDWHKEYSRRLFPHREALPEVLNEHTLKAWRRGEI